MPVRAGWSPVRMVEWPGQVSVARGSDSRCGTPSPREPREPAGELRAIFVEQVGRELVDRNDDEQAWAAAGVCAADCERETGRRDCKDELTHATNPPRHPGESRGLPSFCSKEKAVPGLNPG